MYHGNCNTKQWTTGMAGWNSKPLPRHSQMGCLVGHHEIPHISGIQRFGYSNITLTESRNYTLKHQIQPWLLETAQDDTFSMVIQNEELKSFLAQTITSNEKRPSSMTCDRPDGNTEIHATKAHTAEFCNRKLGRGAWEENNNPRFCTRKWYTV